jgi:hypothetical protein
MSFSNSVKGSTDNNKDALGYVTWSTRTRIDKQTRIARGGVLNYASDLVCYLIFSSLSVDQIYVIVVVS